MIFFRYPNLDSIFNTIPTDKELIIIRHMLAAGEEIKPHHHPRANEWLVVDRSMSGTKGVVSFVVAVGETVQRFDIMDGTFFISLPKKERHSLKAITDIAYLVMRDRKDRTVYDR